MKTPKIPLIIILGPTATGKSDLAVRIARKMKGEVISADSRQVYRDLNIGTGKITKEEMKSVPHHLLDVADPKIPANSPSRYSVETWRSSAEKIITEIHKRGHIPIICGGTGFYIEALVNGVVLPDVPPNTALRKKLEKKSATELFEMLKKIDPARAENMFNGKGTRKNGKKVNEKGVNSGDWQNPRRIIRAIEIATALGKVPTIKKTKPSASPYSPIFIGLTLPPEELKNKIKIRLEKRLEQGMITEVKKLHKNGLTWKRMYELGLEYRSIADYLQTKQTPADQKNMSEKLATEIWHYARRQMSWFRHEKRIVWFTPKQTKTKTKVFLTKLAKGLK